MKIITLISDWKLRDPYVAMFKGRILSAVPDAQLLDITHAVEKFDLLQTAVILQQSYDSFPKGTVHLVLTNTDENLNNDPIIVQWNDHYFIGPDDKIFSLLLHTDAYPHRRYHIENKDNTSFFTKIIQLLKAHFDNKIDKITTPKEELAETLSPISALTVSEKRIKGHVIYLDAFGNAITDIPCKVFAAHQKHRTFHATIGQFSCNQYAPTYRSDFKSNIYLTNNMLGFIEITIYRAHTAILTDLSIGTEVTIDFQ